MEIPLLNRNSRSHEYDKYSPDLRADIIYQWLFENKTHRDLDEDILGISRETSKGYQSMNVLHFVGLRGKTRGIFQQQKLPKVITVLNADDQDFSIIVGHLELLNQRVTSLSTLKLIESEELERSQSDPSELRRKRLANHTGKPKRKRVYSYTYQRNPDIVAEALYRAKGVCERCNSPAPFLRASNNTPYLEVHHIISLSNGGDDTLENVLALCPNCHRELHFGINPEIN